MAPSFRERFVGEATPRSIALIRILVCTLALAQVVSADLSSLAALPAELRARMGVLNAFELLPVGLLAVLSCAPCADALSLDALRRRRSGRPLPEPNRPAAAYGWARYACWITIALPYVLAGMTKLVRGGLGWWEPLNLKHHLLWADPSGSWPMRCRAMNRQVARLFVEQREWDFVAEPAGPESGAVVARYVYEARPGNRFEPARGRRDGNASPLPSPANSEAAQP